jgi:hypothetical protein
MGKAKHAGTRLTMSVGAAVLVGMSTVVPAPESTAVRLSADSTALILGGSSVPTPDNAYIDAVKNQYIAPTHPGQDINYIAVTTPEEFWPLTGLIRLVGSALGAPSVWGPGGPGWPDEPWWKLSGLSDLTVDQSIQAGVADLEAAMSAHGNDHLVIYGYSQGAIIANLEKRKLAEQYPAGTTAPNIDFVLSGDLNVPNGGLHARFPGLYIPILDWSFNGPEPTGTQFHTTVITRQYDGLADFPLYPLNVVADLNAVLGDIYVHLNDLDVSLPPDPTTSPAYQGTHGDTSYYFFPTQDLPLFAPLRTLGVPEPVIDVVEPFFRVLVELGYDRSIPPWEPTPARLIPTLDPAKVATDLVNAIGEAINNAPASAPAPQSTHASVTTATAGPVDAPPVTKTASANITPQVTSTGTAIETPKTSAEAATSTTNVTETGQAPQSMAADASETSTKPTRGLSVSTPTKPAKPAGRHLVRDSLREQHPGVPHRGKGDLPTIQGAAPGDEEKARPR